MCYISFVTGLVVVIFVLVALGFDDLLDFGYFAFAGFCSIGLFGLLFVLVLFRVLSCYFV